MANDVITPFGAAGTRTARVDAPAVGLGSGELLIYTVTAEGADPAFGFACKHGEILSARTLDGGDPRKEYQWEYEPDDPDDVVVLELSFVAIIKYTVRIDRISEAGALIETVRDADYESLDPEDTAIDNLSVLLV